MHAILDSGTLLGRYELVMPIAQGGMSEVWLARAKGARGFQQLFAIKALLPVHASNPELVTMFLDEARIASKIRHPNVVGILDLGEQDGVLYLAMEWVEGETVASLLRKGPVPLKVATRIALDTCRAAHAAHELRDEDGRPYGLVHRDISPQNVLLSPGGAIKLTDFGVLKASFGREIAETLPGRVKGKAAYMAPEQILDSSKLDRRGDVFALGVVLYRLALGEHPFRGKNDVETMTNIVRAALPLELSIEGDPELLPLAQLLRKALSKKPGDRFATAADMAEALEALGPAAAPAGPDEVIAYVREAAGPQVRARRKLVMRTLQELDGAPADPRPSGLAPSGASSVSPFVTSAARLPAAAPIIIEPPSASDATPAPIVEIDVAPPSLADLGRAGPRRRLRWREQAKGAAFAVLALVVGNALLNVANVRASSGRGEPAASRPAGDVALSPSYRPLGPGMQPSAPPVAPAHDAASSPHLAAPPAFVQPHSAGAAPPKEGTTSSPAPHAVKAAHGPSAATAAHSPAATEAPAAGHDRSNSSSTTTSSNRPAHAATTPAHSSPAPASAPGAVRSASPAPAPTPARSAAPVAPPQAKARAEEAPALLTRD